MPPFKLLKNTSLRVPLTVILMSLVLGVILVAVPGTLSTILILGIAAIALPLAALRVTMQAWLALRRGGYFLSALLFVLACLLLVLALPAVGRLIEFVSTL